MHDMPGMSLRIRQRKASAPQAQFTEFKSLFPWREVRTNTPLLSGLMQRAVQLLLLFQLWSCKALVDRSSGEAKNCKGEADLCDAEFECDRCTSAYRAPTDPPTLTCSQVVEFMRRSFPSDCDIGRGALHQLSICALASALQGSGVDCSNYEITSTDKTIAPTAAPSAAPTSAPFAIGLASRGLDSADGDAASDCTTVCNQRLTVVPVHLTLAIMLPKLSSAVWRRQLDADTELLLVHADEQYSDQILLLSQEVVAGGIAAAKSGEQRQRQQLANTCDDGKQWLLYAATASSEAHSGAAYTVQQPVYQSTDCTDDPALSMNWYVRAERRSVDSMRDAVAVSIRCIVVAQSCTRLHALCGAVHTNRYTAGSAGWRGSAAVSAAVSVECVADFTLD
eukprot:6395-Heterococcus_DN1.PRE.1